MFGGLLSDQPISPAPNIPGTGGLTPASGFGASKVVPPGIGDLNYLQSLLIGVNTQELFPGSSPTFVSLTLSGLTASLLTGTDANKALVSVTPGVSLSWSGTTLNAIQNIRATDSPTFAGLTLTTGAGASKVWTSDAGGVGSWASPGAPAAHVLDSASHTVSGLTAGHFLKSLSATTFGFAAHGLTYSDVGAEASGVVATHAALTTGVHGLVFTAGKTLTLTESLTLNALTALRLPVATSANTIGELAAVGATGEYLKGNTAAIPSWATLNQAAVAGLTATDSPTFESIGIHDTDDSHHLMFAAGSNLSADRILTFTTGDAARTITLSGNPTLNDWFDQSVKTTALPTHDSLKLTSASSTPYLGLEHNVTPSNNVELGDITWRDNGSGEIYAKIGGAVDATGAGATTRPGRLCFYTTLNGYNSPIERMRITNDGKVGIGTTVGAAYLNIGVGVAADVTDYGRGLQITRGASNTGQHISLIRSSTAVFSLGFIYGTSTFAIGPGQSTDSDFDTTHVNLSIPASGAIKMHHGAEILGNIDFSEAGTTGQAIRGNRTSGEIALYGVSGPTDGTYILLYGPSHSTAPGQVHIASYGSSGAIRFYNYTGGWTELCSINNVGAMVVASTVYAQGNVSADSFTDRTKGPRDIAHALELLQSMKFKNEKADYSVLHPDIKKEGKIADPTTGESKPSVGRDLSLLVSCLVEAVNDISGRLEKLEKQK
jgi:hypothetical protein